MSQNVRTAVARPATGPTPLRARELTADELARATARADELLGARVAVLTGAGMSTDSGIPDYRGPDSVPRSPMTFREFQRSAADRQRYWARSHLGWTVMDAARPNDGHRSVAALQHAGRVSGVVTQNVDGLHQSAGAQRVIDLHGRLDRVACLDCGAVGDRHRLHGRLQQANRTWGVDHASAGADVAPDGDVALEDTSGFVVVGCERCGGVLKPDVVFFGESVPRQRVEQAFALVDDAGSLLVLGSSLTVWSGRRFVARAAQSGKPVVIVNRGVTRADDVADLTVHARCADFLAGLLER